MPHEEGLLTTPLLFSREGGFGGGVLRLSMRWQVTRVLWFKNLFKLLACPACAALKTSTVYMRKGQHSFWDQGSVDPARVREGTSEATQRNLGLNQPKRDSGRQRTLKNWSLRGWIEKPAPL